MTRDRPDQRIGEFASQHRCDLRDLLSRPQTVEPRRQQGLQGRGDGLHRGLSVAFKEQSGHLLDEERDAAGTNYQRGDALQTLRAAVDSPPGPAVPTAAPPAAPIARGRARPRDARQRARQGDPPALAPAPPVAAWRSRRKDETACFAKAVNRRIPSTY